MLQFLQSPTDLTFSSCDPNPLQWPKHTCNNSLPHGISLRMNYVSVYNLDGDYERGHNHRSIYDRRHFLEILSMFLSSPKCHHLVHHNQIRCNLVLQRRPAYKSRFDVFYLYLFIECIQSKDYDTITMQIYFLFVLDTLFLVSVRIDLTDQISSSDLSSSENLSVRFLLVFLFVFICIA